MDEKERLYERWLSANAVIIRKIENNKLIVSVMADYFEGLEMIERINHVDSIIKKLDHSTYTKYSLLYELFTPKEALKSLVNFYSEFGSIQDGNV